MKMSRSFIAMALTALAVLSSPILASIILRWWRSKFRSGSRSRSRSGSRSLTLTCEKEEMETKRGDSQDHHNKLFEHDVIQDQVDSSLQKAPKYPDENGSLTSYNVASGHEEAVIEEEITCATSTTSFLSAQPKSSVEEINQETQRSHAEIAARIGLDFPFFIDPETHTYISKPESKVMFIMRGLSGSGKSTIVKVMKHRFKQVTVCSADDFFYQEDGSYAFDANKLKSAHGESQQKAREACESGVSVVVIDNTNVKRWEMKTYLQIAKLNGYVTVLVESKMPWRLDAKELASKNKHGVSIEVLEQKVRSFEDIIPFYYAWFLNESRSKQLIDLAARYLKACLRLFPDFEQELLQQLRSNASHLSSQDEDQETAEEILHKYYGHERRIGPVVHCTSFYCNSGKVPGSKAYHCREEVRRSYGKVHSLTITGLTITTKSFGARVTLDDDCKSLFKRPEEEEWRGLPGADEEVYERKRNKKGKASKTKNKKNLKIATAEASRMCGFDHASWNGAKKDSGDCVSAAEMSRVSLEEEDPGNSSRNGDDKPVLNLKQMFPQLHNTGFARSAHITLKIGNHVESKQTNFDVLNVCDIEQRTVQNQNQSFSLCTVLDGKACYYGDGVCCVYFPKPLVGNALFSGYY